MIREELVRYSRQIMLPEIDIEGQNKIKEASVGIIGMGGLGCPSAIFSSVSGFGSISLFDHDLIDISNLQRQILFNSNDIGKNKSSVALKKIKLLNENTFVKSEPVKITEENISSKLFDLKIILDCSDNFETRKIINKYCFENKKILISGSSVFWTGQLMSFDFSNKNQPCYQCLFEDLDEEDLSCRESAIISPLVGIIGSYMVLEAIKIITNSSPRNQFIQINTLTGDIKRLNFSKNKNCKICGAS
tara:strand:+ start:596 stop:1336 length:741 start_codon:yes stop_codon:yes gene_type:complete